MALGPALVYPLSESVIWFHSRMEKLNGNQQPPSREATKTRRSDKNVPDYKPIPLRAPFLLALLAYISVLFVLLEVSFHKVPVVADRRTAARPALLGDNSAIFSGRRELPAATKRRLVRQNTPATVNATATTTTTPYTGTAMPETNASASTTKNANTTTTPTTTWTQPDWTEYPSPTTFPSWTYKRPNHTALITHTVSTATSLAKMLAAHPDPSQWAQVGPQKGTVTAIGHYVMAFVWTRGVPSFVRTPVRPGDDITNRCLLHDFNGWLTDDPEDCPMLVWYDLSDYLPGFGYSWRGGPIDPECRAYEAEQRAILQPYYDHPQCFSTELQDRRIIYLNETADDDFLPGYSIVSLTTAVTDRSGRRTTLTLRTTVGSAVATWTLPDGKVMTTTRRPYDRGPLPFVLATLTDAAGRPTATITSFPLGGRGPAAYETTIFTTDAFGQSTIYTTTVLPTSLLTLRDKQGNPTATVPVVLPKSKPGPPGGGEIPRPTSVTTASGIYLGPISVGGYLAGSFAPVFLATVLGLAIKAVQGEIVGLKRFHALVIASDSHPTSGESKGGSGLKRMARMARMAGIQQVSVLSVVGTGLVVLSNILVALASEALGLTLSGDCRPTNFDGCAMSLAVVRGPARAVEALLAMCFVGVVVVAIGLRGWSTGVAAPSRSIVSVASLLCSADRNTRDAIRRMRFGDRNTPGFRLAMGRNQSDYRLEVAPNGGGKKLRLRRSWHNKFRRLAELVFLAMLFALLAIIIAYETTAEGTAFADFMNSQSLGVGFLFTGLGVVLSLSWEQYFQCKYFHFLSFPFHSSCFFSFFCLFFVFFLIFVLFSFFFPLLFLFTFLPFLPSFSLLNLFWSTSNPPRDGNTGTLPPHGIPPTTRPHIHPPCPSLLRLFWTLGRTGTTRPRGICRLPRRVPCHLHAAFPLQCSVPPNIDMDDP